MKVIISGGGTGGHIFPAIAIANALKLKDAGTDILFVGAQGRMEMEKVPAAGYQIIGLPVAGFQRRLTLANLSFPFKLIKSLWRAKQIIKDFHPDVVIGVGGYASGPVLQMATTLHKPCLIQEQNSFPGVTNKLLAQKVEKICVAYENMETFFPKEKIVFTGNPIRQDISGLSEKKTEALSFFHLNPEKKTLLVMGGSLGALTINKSTVTLLELTEQYNLQIIWQTGKSYYQEACRQTEGMPNVQVFDFISRMDLVYAASDMVVSRAGAIAISELCVVQKPCILIPSPNVAEDHQTKNAMALVNKQAALMVKDAEAEEQLKNTVISLIENESLQKTLSSNIGLLAKTNAAEAIAMVAIALTLPKKKS